MTNSPCTITLNSPEETAEFAARLGADLRSGDILLLEGEIGSGKTHFARSLIQSLMIEPEDVPSPTFTLVQAYDTPAGEIWHCDLYRLSAVEEVEELGLTEAFEAAICLIEWPDKLGPLMPDSAAKLSFETDPSMTDIRHLTVSWSDPKWPVKLRIPA
ncbi:tRNA (adenosine(37)-N6)-threonylcarbamoyltransferase complex ATPase subunit type 1 TsaE [Ruegeria sp. A3M17]|uniref:tRNA (adenosine(37)-N6)-threonylcarbamoyltransferase complex ATPase subunit type 1 TsaE n=1 Tax=Ruegeria sp. A3M17 TaxID=2267229 RepID=UPI000DE8AB46|nr:tRNA (adenosine(37)-N6)-threonylcarbamoyltransferase complex ATPase subunit type 1 TsaE [Ruegeria sp. A3M17]RBW55109.1 tRNA (adenosine(37)-N6)-threonylcarbamoyltransferase complex ATPase subunit type 1 TsaE [Ruegeria sp. A3M17]